MRFFAEAGRKNQVAGFLLVLIYFLFILQIFHDEIYLRKENQQNKSPKQPSNVNWALRK